MLHNGNVYVNIYMFRDGMSEWFIHPLNIFTTPFLPCSPSTYLCPQTHQFLVPFQNWWPSIWCYDLGEKKKKRYPDICSLLHIKYQCYALRGLGIKVVSQVMYTRRLSSVRERLMSRGCVYLSVFEDGLSPVEQQQTHVAVSEAEVALQDLQHVDAGPHGQRGVTAEWMQPSQEVIWSHWAVTERERERGRWEGQQSDGHREWGGDKETEIEREKCRGESKKRTEVSELRLKGQFTPKSKVDVFPLTCSAVFQSRCVLVWVV